VAFEGCSEAWDRVREVKLVDESVSEGMQVERWVGCATKGTDDPS
jgi:hypothetical protein